MYNQSVQPQQYQVPYLQPVGNPSQGDSLDQASRLIDLVEKIAARHNGAGNLAPGTSQYSPINAGQFQSRSQEELAAQELALRSLSNNQQSHINSQHQQSHGSKAISREDIVKVNQSAVNAANAFHYQQKLLSESAILNDSLMNAVNALQTHLYRQEDIAKLGIIANELSNVFSRELDAAHEMIAVQNQMLNSPLFLLAHSFLVFNNTIQSGDREAIDLISSYYLELVKNFENQNLAVSGKYSPEYSQYLQGQMGPSHSYQSPQPNYDQSKLEDSIANFAEGLKSPGFAHSLKRAHVSRNLLR